MRILAIDPGTTESGYCVLHSCNFKPISFGKITNEQLRELIYDGEYESVVIEMVASYGMPVGAEVFETCKWAGKFEERATDYTDDITYIIRNTVKNNLCHSSRANDATIKQALVDRFANGKRNHGKGTKDNPGFFYGFKKDIWAAFALGVTYLDLKNRGEL